jgi:DNA-binding CsgD family transcriptional regulator
MPLCRGIGLCNLRVYVVEQHGERAWERVKESLWATDRVELERVTEASWSDAGLHDRVTRAVCDVLGGGSLYLASCIGRASAERNATGVMRWFYQLIDPEYAIRNMSIYWRRMSIYWRRDRDGGYFRAEMDHERVIATLHDWQQDEACCMSLLHYLGRILEFFGRVSALEHPRCRSHGDAWCEYRARFRLGEISDSGDMAVQSLPEALAALREIAGMGDADAVRNAIVRLFTRFLGARGVELLRMDEAKAAASITEKRTEPPVQKFVLEHAGAAVGYLVLEPPTDTALQAMIHEIVPWLGLVLAPSSAPRTSEQTMRARDLKDCLRHAKQAVALTRRELDVVALAAQGRSNKEVACELGISEATVEVHMTHIFRKYGVDGRGALIAQFWRAD